LTLSRWLLPRWRRRMRHAAAAGSWCLPRQPAAEHLPASTARPGSGRAVIADLIAGAAALARPLVEESQFAPGPEGPAGASFAMLHGLYWLLANLAFRQPMLVAVDDLHWADEASLRWIAYLAPRIDGLPLLLALATRPPEQSPEPGVLAQILSDPTDVRHRP